MGLILIVVHRNRLQCQDFRSTCQKKTLKGNASLAPFCEKEAETSCCEAADHDVKIFNEQKYENGITLVTTQSGKDDANQTVGLYNECKCDFWLHICEDTRAGEACDYAAEYCCGDYLYKGIGFMYLNSPS
eukprot:scaffold36270_cov80-Skeletonema_marinoi.AAC.1